MAPQLIFLIISMAASAASAIAKAKAQRAQAEQAQKVAEYNAVKQEANAKEEESARLSESVNERNQSRRRLAEMTARYAKSGLLETGTVTHTLSEQAEADEYNILNRDRVSAWKQEGYKEQASLLRYEGEAAIQAGKTAQRNTYLGAAASMAGSAAGYGLSVGSQNNPDPAPESVGTSRLSYADEIQAPYKAYGDFDTTNNGMIYA